MPMRFHVILPALLACATLSGGAFLNAGELRGGSDAIVIYPDLGIETVLEAQAAANPEEDDEQDAETKLQDFIDSKGFMPGWNASDYNDMEVYFAIGVGKFDTDNPASDERFIENRELAAIEAILRAKSDVISSLFLADFKAEQRIDIPGTPEYAASEQRYAPFRKKMENLWEQMQREMPENQPNGAPVFSRTNVQLFDGMHARLENAVYSGEIVNAKWVNYNNAYEELSKEYEALMENAVAIQKISTNVSAASRMPLMGGTVIYQTEAWDEDTQVYSVGVVLCWSKQLQIAAFATLSGKQTDSSNLPKGAPMSSWLKNLDYSRAVGPRQFLDDKGRFHMVGISAMPVGKNAPRDSHNRRIADLNAQAMAMLALRADVELSSGSQARNEVFTDDSGDMSTETAGRLKELITQSYSGGSISGLQSRRRVKVKHNKSKGTMHVAVYSISAQDAARTMTR